MTIWLYVLGYCSFWEYSGASLELTAASLLTLGWLSHLLWVSPAFMVMSLY